MRTGWSPAFSSQKSSGVDRLTVGANYGGKQANLCSSGRWPVENNPEESKQVPAKNLGLGRRNDLWTCKRYRRPTSGGRPWAELSWPITQRKGQNKSLTNETEHPFLSYGIILCILNVVNSHSKYMNLPQCLCHTCCTFTHKYQTLHSLVDQHWCSTQTLHLCQTHLQNITRIFPYQKDQKEISEKSEGSPVQDEWNIVQLQGKQ